VYVRGAKKNVNRDVRYVSVLFVDGMRMKLV